MSDPGSNNNGSDAEDTGSRASSALRSEDGGLMVLLRNERSLARQLKEATLAVCQGDDEDYRDAVKQVEGITDFEYVQHAMVILYNPSKFPGVNVARGVADEDTTKDAVDRILRLQYFREVYGVTNTVQQGVQAIRALIEQQPAFLLHLDRHYMDNGGGGRVAITDDFDDLDDDDDDEFDDDDDDDDSDDDNHNVAVAERRRRNTGEPAIPRDCRTCVLVGDVARIDWAASVADETAIRIKLLGRYYHLQAVFPHFAAMRQGCLFIFEVEGLGYEPYLLILKSLKRYSTELLQAYPCNFKALQYYHTPSVANMIYSVFKQFFDEKFGSKLQWGLRLEPDMAARHDRLSDIFASATMENLLEKGTSLLEERGRNEANFTL